MNQRLLRLAHRPSRMATCGPSSRPWTPTIDGMKERRGRSQKREDVDAATFVEKVLQQRDQDHVKAWRSFMEATKSRYVDESHRDDGSTSLIPGPRLRLLLDGLGSEVTPEQEAAARAALAPVEAGRRHRKEIADSAACRARWRRQ